MIRSYTILVKLTGFFCLFFSCFFSSKAQISCGTDQYKIYLGRNKSYLQKEQEIKSQWVAFKKTNLVPRTAEDLYSLPVVFHIIHQNGPENIPDAVVMDAFQRLNDAFANRGIYDQGSGVDTKIQFCMAQKDPDGNYSTGITRTYADLVTVNPAIHQQLLETLIKWDPTKYINIWVVSDVDLAIEFNHCGYGDQEAAGYGGGGIVVAEANSLPAIIVHEMGHALGLDHTFSGWCVNNDCLVDGDGICDTPPEETITINRSCSDPENSCHTDTQSGFSTDQNDLKTNHMDYGNQSCQHDFTQGQKEKMRFMIETFHPGWLTADVCLNDCASPAEAEFTFLTIPEYSIGNTVNFTNTSVGATAYEWSINNVFVSSSVNLVYTFPGQGWYKINLLAKPSPDDVKCRNNQVNWIRVYCSIKSKVKADKKKAKVGETIHFSSIIEEVVSMPEPVQYEWYYNNILFGTSPSFDFSFTTPGIKIFYLVTIRGTCRDTSLAGMVDIKGLPDYTLKLNGPVCTGNKINKISFSVCNKGHFDTPAGLPITFYSSNPTSGPAVTVGSTFYTNDIITPYCCKDFEIELPAGYTGNYLFGVVNDNHSKPTPYNLATDFPVTSFFESTYTNNLDSLSLEKFKVFISPQEANVLMGTSVNLTGTPTQPASLLWMADFGTFSCGSCSATNFSPKKYTRVILKGITAGNCVATDTIIVKVLANGDVFIPSAFTPNGDELNDYFYVLCGESVNKISSFMLFNRWGEKILSRQNTLPNIPQLGWNGTRNGYLCPIGVYIYLITVEFVNGTKRSYKGTVTLIR